MRVLIFRGELDPNQPPRERVPRDRLSRASRCARRRHVDGADRHDQSGSCVRSPRGRRVPDLADVRRADRDRQVVELVKFETADPDLRGEMPITISLADADGGGTDVLAVHDGLPSGVPIADNEAGWREALAKLAALVEEG